MKSTIQIACSNEQGEGKCQARLAQSVERQALNLVVGGSSPPVGVLLFFSICGGVLVFVIGDWDGVISTHTWILIISYSHSCMCE